MNNPDIHLTITPGDKPTLNYERIARAIEFIRENRLQQPDLTAVAAAVNMSPFHFQRIFTEWAGISPKRFLQFLNVEQAKRILRETRASLFDTACEVGLSGSGRLHDLFIKIEGMTPGEYKNAGAGLTINFSFAPTLFGDVIIASTAKGICFLAFTDSKTQGLRLLQERFPSGRYLQRSDEFQQNALSAIAGESCDLQQIKLHLKGTEFQLKVWSALLCIPVGGLTTYGDIAAGIEHPKACRAVGTAVGDNPVAVLIPCHRVIRATGEIGNYRWGQTRKIAILSREISK